MSDGGQIGGGAWISILGCGAPAGAIPTGGGDMFTVDGDMRIQGRASGAEAQLQPGV